MPNFWKRIKDLFKEADQSSPSNPAIHEIIQRSETEINDFEKWKNTLVKRRLVDWLDQQYAIYRVLPDDIDEGLDFLNTPSSKGFVIHFYKTNYSKREVVHFFDYLKDQVVQQDYWPQVSDTRTYNRPDWVETVERHYLKPKPDFSPHDSRINQRFGNITIENIFRNDKPYHLKFRVNSYNDNLFLQAKDFQELMTKILTQI